MEKTIILSGKEQRQAQVLTRLVAGRLSRVEAAQLLGLSQRQIQRKSARFEAEGVSALVHGNRGRAPGHKTEEALVSRILALAGQEGPLHEFNVCHLQEILAEQQQITIGRSTLDRLLKEQGIRKAKKGGSSRPRRKRRERKSAEGMLVQMDGSPHDWLQGRGPRMCLMGSIDDATGKVLYLHFHPTESQEAYLRMLRQIAREHGLPMAVYHDRHTILRSPKEATIEEELAGKEPMSQVQRVLHELGVESIAALSPQAKGRIERLWGTLQDRLVGEMRLAQVENLEQANAFLPGFLIRFNPRFAIEPQDPEPAWVSLPADVDLDYFFAARHRRTVRADHTLSFEGKTLQVLDKKNLAGQKVAVHVVPAAQTAAQAATEGKQGEKGEKGAELVLYRGKDRLVYRLLEAAPLQPPKQEQSAKSAGKAPVLIWGTPPYLEEKVLDPQAQADACSARARRHAWLHGPRQQGRQGRQGEVP